MKNPTTFLFYIILLNLSMNLIKCISFNTNSAMIPKSKLHITQTDSYNDNDYYYTINMNIYNYKIKLGVIIDNDIDYDILIDSEILREISGGYVDLKKITGILTNCQFKDIYNEKEFQLKYKIYSNITYNNNLNGFINLVSLIKKFNTKDIIYLEYDKKFQAINNNLRITLGENINTKEDNQICYLKKGFNCQLNYMTILDKNNIEIESFKIDEYTIFNPGEKRIIGPLNVGNSFISFILSISPYKDFCNKLINSNSNSLSFYCSSDANIYSFPDIVLTFKKKELQIIIKAERLFYRKFDLFNNKYIYMSRMEFFEESEGWIIGYPGIGGLDLIIDDVNSNSIIFPNLKKNDIMELTYKSSTYRSNLLFTFGVIIAIIIVISAVFLYLYYMKNCMNLMSKKQMEKQENMMKNIQKLEEYE